MRSGPSSWMIGDVQGCCQPLRALLTHPEIARDPLARFWFAGDLINRGPDSLGTLRAVMDLGDRAVSVLGRSEEHTSEIQSLMRISYAVFCLKKKSTS